MEKATKKTLLRILFAVLGLTVVFLSGSMHENTHFERIAEYSSQVVKTSTFDKRYCAISFDAPNKPGDYYASELQNLFDVFRSGVVTYASGMNVHKEQNIRLKGCSDDNLSLFFVGAIGSIEIKDDDEKIIGWRHYKYNIETMFNDPQYNGTEYDKKHVPVIYLSQQQADKILELRGVVKEGTNYSPQQYRSLIQTDVTLKIEGDDCTYSIWNIFYNKDFYCEGLADILGEYALTSYYQPVNHDLRQIHKSIYYFNEYSYYNQYLMRYLNERFSDGEVHPYVIRNNLVKEIDYDFLLSFYHNETISAKHWIYTVLMILAICFIAVSVFILFASNRDDMLISLVTIVSLFIPYLIFKLIFVITNDVLFFSQPVCKLYVLFVVLYIFVYLYKTFIMKRIIKKNKILGYYEVNI